MVMNDVDLFFLQATKHMQLRLQLNTVSSGCDFSTLSPFALQTTIC